MSAQLLYYSRYLHRLHVSTIDYSSSGLFLSFESQDAMHTFGSHHVYIHGIHQIKSFVSKGVTCKLCLQQWDTNNWIICLVKCVAQIV